MLDLFDKEGFDVVFADRLLMFNEEGTRLFPDAFRETFVKNYGSLMWHFDLVKRA